MRSPRPPTGARPPPATAAWLTAACTRGCRRADAEALADPPHREALAAVRLEDLACGGDDLERPRAERLRSAGSHRACASRSRWRGRARRAGPTPARRPARRRAGRAM